MSPDLSFLSVAVLLKYSSLRRSGRFSVLISTRVDVPMTYDWHTRLKGTPLIENGPGGR